jgi:hypothetical protein
MDTNEDAQELWEFVLAEIKELDPDVRMLLGKALDARAPWDLLPPRLQAAIEEWAALVTAE